MTISKSLGLPVLPGIAAPDREPRARARTDDRGDDPDADVIAVIDRGNLAGAVQRLMERYGTPVFRYCRVALRDAALAEDVHQQVFLEAYRDLPRFRRSSTLRVWLFAIARHRVLDAAKQRRRRARGFVDDPHAGDVPDLQPSPGESLDDARLRAALVTCVDALPDSTRTAILLHYQQGFTFAEMSVICHEQAGTLCARVARALPLLRKRIEAVLARR